MAMWPQGRKHVVIGRSKHTTHSPSCAVFEAKHVIQIDSIQAQGELGVSKSLHNIGCYDRLIEYVYIYKYNIIYHIYIYNIIISIHIVSMRVIVSLSFSTSSATWKTCGVGSSKGGAEADAQDSIAGHKWKMPSPHCREFSSTTLDSAIQIYLRKACTMIYNVHPCCNFSFFWCFFWLMCHIVLICQCVVHAEKLFVPKFRMAHEPRNPAPKFWPTNLAKNRTARLAQAMGTRACQFQSWSNVG